MPHLARLAPILVLLFAGCLPITRSITDADVRPRKEVGPDRIEISNGFGSGIYGGGTMRAKWVLEKSGLCRGTVTTGWNANARRDQTTEYDLPAETFEECRALLESTNFFRLKVPRPEFLFEASGWDITAEYKGRKNAVIVYSSSQPAGFVKLREFLDELPKRGKVTSTTAPPD